MHPHLPHTLVVASPRLLESLALEPGGQEVLALAQGCNNDLLKTLERHRHLLTGLHTLVLAGPCVGDGLQIGSTPTTAASLLRLRRRWQAALPASLVRVDLFVTAGSCRPELLHNLALVSSAEVRLAEPQHRLQLTTVADGNTHGRRPAARNRIMPFLRQSA